MDVSYYDSRPPSPSDSYPSRPCTPSTQNTSAPRRPNHYTAHSTGSLPRPRLRPLPIRKTSSTFSNSTTLNNVNGTVYTPSEVITASRTVSAARTTSTTPIPPKPNHSSIPKRRRVSETRPSVLVGLAGRLARLRRFVTTRMRTSTVAPSGEGPRRRSSLANLAKNPQVSALARRIHGWTWQAFPIGMGTGAVYVTLSGLQEQSRTLVAVQTAFYFLNMLLFLLNSSALAIQATVYPRRSWQLIKDPTKGIFVPLIVLSFATIVIGTINYAVPSGHVRSEFIYVLFWVYVAFAVLVSFPMLMIWFNKGHDIKGFTPAYAFLIFPMMLVGVVSFNVLKTMDPADPRALGVLTVGYFFQGIGMFMTFFYLCIFIIRIMTTGFLEGHQANGAFVACGPPGFTALALLNLGARAREILPAHSLISPLAGEIWFASSVLVALMLFGLAVFFFVFGLLPYWWKVHKDLSEILGCWALTFPNVGWISTLSILGRVLDIPGFFTLHLIMTILMCITWLVLFVLTLLAFWRGLIFRSEEKDVLLDSRYAGNGDLASANHVSPPLTYDDSGEQGRSADRPRLEQGGSTADLEKGFPHTLSLDSCAPSSLAHSNTSTVRLIDERGGPVMVERSGLRLT